MIFLFLVFFWANRNWHGRYRDCFDGYLKDEHRGKMRTMTLSDLCQFNGRIFAVGMLEKDMMRQCDRLDGRGEK